jgi:hypothetical protein
MYFLLNVNNPDEVECMKKLLGLFPVGVLIALSTVSAVSAAPWVYPASEANPTITDYWVTPLTAGTNTIRLVLWNHANKDNYVNGNFVIAIKSGFSQVTFDSVKVAGVPLALDAEDLTGATTPGHPFPSGGIFPCPWKQYAIANLTEWASPDGWQGLGDSSGVTVDVQVTVAGSPTTVQLYFLSWGYDQKSNGNLKESDTPYSQITQTYSVPLFVVPESPLGALTAVGSMLLAFGAYSLVRKRKSRQ